MKVVYKEYIVYLYTTHKEHYIFFIIFGYKDLLPVIFDNFIEI